MRNQKGLSPIAVIILTGVAILGYLAYSGKINLPQNQTDTALTPSTTQPSISNNETANWKTYSNLGYSFKYPSNLFYSQSQSGYPQFHVSQKEEDEAANCLKNRLGTLEKQCNTGLFDVEEIAFGSDHSKDVEKSIKYQEENAKNSLLTKYKDQTSREWRILGPVYGLGGTVTTAEVNIDNTKHWVQIHIWDSFMDPVKDSSIEEQLLFIKKLFSSFKFK